MAFSANDGLLATGADDATCLVWQAPRRTARATARLEHATCERLWADLANADASRAHHAIAELVHCGDSAVAFLTERLRPPAPLDVQVVNRLLRHLDSPQFATRERAGGELQRLGAEVIPVLHRSMSQSGRSQEFAARVGALIETLAIPSHERLREYRSLEVLETIGSPGAQALLKTIGQGAATSRVAQIAAASAQRLGKRTHRAP